jgi:NAD(P)H-nitrite reductase large subunit
MSLKEIPPDQRVNCVCFSVHFFDLIKIIEEHDCKDYKDVQKHCKAGKKCGLCIPYINDYCNS